MATTATTMPLGELGASRADQLERIAQAGLVKQGRVFVLSLDAIRAELGARWPGRSDLVWETTYRALVKRMPLPDIFIRIDDATILAAVASVDAYEGQVRCADVLRSTLAFFLGRSAEGDLRMSRVSNLSEGALSCEPVDLLAPPPPPSRSKAGSGMAVARAPENWTPPLAGRSFAAPFVSEHCGTVPLRFDVVPVWRLDQGIISAYAIRRRLPARIETYGDHDRETMGHLLLDHLIPLLEEYRREGGVFALIMPGSFTNASARRPRQSLISHCATVRDVMQKAVVMELEGFGPGVPAGRIRETAAMMRPFFRVLTACVRDIGEAEATVRDYAFQGMAIDAERISDDRLDVMVRSVRRRTPNVIVHGVREGADEDRLKALGVSHVTYRDASTRSELTRDGSVRASPPQPVLQAAE